MQGLLDSEAKQHIMRFLLESGQLNVFVCFLFMCVRLMSDEIRGEFTPSWCPWTWTVSSTQSEIVLLGVYSCSETLYVMKYCQKYNKNIVKCYETHVHKM